ncbi:hypothetical protein MKX08_007795 [Trichoderma sp. CBMAI-0020]|nr:hypothetical protein MKX08_007795 [Trichoderma sp. CBMAI-0020]
MYHSNSETRSSTASLSLRDALIDVNRRAQWIAYWTANVLFGIQLNDDSERTEELYFLIRTPKQVVGERPCLCRDKVDCVLDIVLGEAGSYRERISFATISNDAFKMIGISEEEAQKD